MDLKNATGWVRQRLFEFVTLLLAVVAIAFAWVQYHDARTQLDRLQRITSSIDSQFGVLQRITSSIQTQYVGEFPVNLDKIVDVVDQAPEGGELDIMTDFAGYAIYSRNDKYRQYFNKLVEAHGRSVHIKMMVYDKDLVEDAFRKQIKQKDYEEERKNGFRGFFKLRPPEPRDYKEFIDRILDYQNDAANDLCRSGIQLRRVPKQEKYLFFLWQSNRPEAIFAFRNEQERNREISFHSLDPKIIEIFKTIFDQTWNSVDPKTHPNLAAREDPACKYLTSSASTAERGERR